MASSPIEFLSSIAEQHKQSTAAASLIATINTTHHPPQQQQQHEHIIYLRPVIPTDSQNCIQVDSPNAEIIANNKIRPTITIKSTDAAPTVLGRNHTTKIADVTISRAICNLSVTSDGTIKMQMRKRKKSHRLRVDGLAVTADLGEEVVLAVNCRVSLSDDRYEYVVLEKQPVMATATTTTTTTKTTSVAAVRGNVETYDLNNVGTIKGPRIHSSPNQKSEPASKDEKESATLRAAKRLMVDELTCALCMDIMVRAHAASPCGHMLCGSCADKLIQNKADNVGPTEMILRLKGKSSLADCPHCREGITGVTWMRSLDNVIWGMVLRGDFEEDDVRHYIERSGKKPTEEERELLFRKDEKKAVKRESIKNEQSDDHVVQYMPPMKKRRVPTAAAATASINSNPILPPSHHRPMEVLGMAAASITSASMSNSVARPLGVAAASITGTSVPSSVAASAGGTIMHHGQGMNGGSPHLIDLNVGNCNDDAICID